MQDTSQITNFDTIVSTGNYYVETKLNLDGVDYFESSLISLSTSSALFGNVPSVGNCYSAEIDVKMLNPNNVIIPPMAIMKPYIRLYTEDQNTHTIIYSGWLQKGVFFIDTRMVAKDSYGTETITIHGYDPMLKTEALYPVDDPAEYPKLDIDVVDIIAEAIGVEVDDRTYDIITEEYEINLPATYAMREVLQNIAAMYAGNWCITPEGKLRLVGLTDIGIETNLLVDQLGEAIVFGEDRIIV